MRAKTLLSGVVLILLTQAHAAVAQSEPQYFVATIAGTPGVAGFHDGRAREATFDKPTWVDIRTAAGCTAGSAGEIYVVDRVNNAVRVIFGNRVKTFTVSPNPPNPPMAYAFDFDGPFGGGIMVEPPDSGCGCGYYDAGFFVASSGSHEVALLSFGGSVASRDAFVFIGSNAPGSVYYDRPLSMPTGLARSPNYSAPLDRLKERVLYIADSGNHTIRRVDWLLSFEACPQPASVATFAGIADSPGANDGPPSVARFNTPRGLATAQDGSVYVADSGNHTIRRIAVDGTVTTIAGEAGVAGSNDGPALQAHLNTPAGIDVDAVGDLVIADSGNHTIRMLRADGQLVTIAGAAGIAGFADGAGTDARFSGPVGVHVAPDGTILVADTSNHVIRRLYFPGTRRRAVR